MNCTTEVLPVAAGPPAPTLGTTEGRGLGRADLAAYPEYTAFTYIWHICPPILLAAGLAGNVIIILVLRRMWQKHSHQLPFLLSLAGADLCLLLSGLLFEMFFYVFDSDLRRSHVVPCSILTFAMNCSNTVAAWLLVAVTAQRALSVTRPCRVATCCSLQRCFIYLALILALSTLLQLHVLLSQHTPGVHPEEFCSPATARRDPVNVVTATAWSAADLTASCLLPSLSLAICNVFLIRGLRASQRSLSLMCPHGIGCGSNRNHLLSNMKHVVPCLSLLFFCLTVPVYAYALWSDLWREAIRSDPKLLARAELVWAVTNMLWYGNSTVNFVLYCVSGHKFRHELQLMLGCYHHRLLLACCGRHYSCWCCRCCTPRRVSSSASSGSGRSMTGACGHTTLTSGYFSTSKDGAPTCSLHTVQVAAGEGAATSAAAVSSSTKPALSTDSCCACVTADNGGVCFSVASQTPQDLPRPPLPVPHESHTAVDVLAKAGSFRWSRPPLMTLDDSAL